MAASHHPHIVEIESQLVKVFKIDKKLGVKIRFRFGYLGLINLMLSTMKVETALQFD